MKNIFLFAGDLFLIILLISACTSVNNPTTIPSQATYTDPFTYCAAVKTVDKPDERYTGEAIPEEVIQGYLQAAGLKNTTEPEDMLKASTFWRCMDGQVMVCNAGANLPCEAKANSDKTPTHAMSDYCKDNPEVDFIPMAVTGHDTIYDWSCEQGVAKVGEQISKVDAAGFIANIWYALPAGK